MTEVRSISASFDVQQDDGSLVSYAIVARWDERVDWWRSHAIRGGSFSNTPVGIADVIDAVGDDRRREIFAAQASVLWWLVWRRQRVMSGVDNEDPAEDAVTLDELDEDIRRLSDELAALVDGEDLDVGPKPPDATGPISTRPFVREPDVEALIPGEELADHVGDHNLDEFVAALTTGRWFTRSPELPQILGFEVAGADNKRMGLMVHLSEMSWPEVRHLLGLIDTVARGYAPRLGFCTAASFAHLDVEEYVRSYIEPPRFISCSIE